MNPFTQVILPKGVRVVIVTSRDTDFDRDGEPHAKVPVVHALGSKGELIASAGVTDEELAEIRQINIQNGGSYYDLQEVTP